MTNVTRTCHLHILQAAELAVMEIQIKGKKTLIEDEFEN